MASEKMTELLQVSLLYLVLTSTILRISALPVSGSEDEITVEQFLAGRENIKLIEDVLSGMETFLAQNMIKLYTKIISLSQVSDYLLKEGGDVGVLQGKRGDMSDRCPKGFIAVPGDRNCYYFSNYKAPWRFARETCLQLGPDVDMLSIETTKKQFIVTHLLQSNAETKNVKKWWTSGKGTGFDWAWHQRLSVTSFFFKFFNDDSDNQKRDSDSCMILDSDYFYKWKRARCSGSRGSSRNSGETDHSNQPSHHFICQTPALEPSSIEVTNIEQKIPESTRLPSITQSNLQLSTAQNVDVSTEQDTL